MIAKVKGGTGEQFDWDLIPEHCTLPIILAGGLAAHNARDAIVQVQPYALDISSGVSHHKDQNVLVHRAYCKN
jgi:phosphoribosylanthranilate isomerase